MTAPEVLPLQTRTTLNLGCAGSTWPLVESLLASGLLPSAPPDEVRLDSRAVQPSWLEDPSQWQVDGESRLYVIWQESNLVLDQDAKRWLNILDEDEERPPRMLPLTSFVDSLRQKMPDFWGFVLDPSSLSVIKSPQPVGWGLFLKGTERERNILSRQYLERGPWLLREYGDLSVVYFHEFDVDVETKREQSREGHERMFGFRGGLVNDSTFARPPEGATYVPSTRRLDVSVYGREVPVMEMAAVRRIWMRQALGPDQPIERVTYSFADPKEAEAHLYELWLRGLEVVTFLDGYQTVLTDGYEPPPHEPLEWTRRLAARLAEEGL